ncbi:MAG: oxaloacetate decarboxylase [Proteobacteria bacterium]|nr:oxaloacetate decarboxylase [Pseudomonadota bacterium]
MSKGKLFKELVNAPEILVCPGVYDGFSLKITEQAGFKAGSITGAGVSECHFGWPDHGIMGFEGNLRISRMLAERTELPLRVDADTGYGNAVTVHFVCRAFEKAGLASMMIEDQVWPKRCGHMAGKGVIPTEEMVEKVRAAADARIDQDFCIMARTDSAAVHGIDDVIDRLCRFVEAGADICYADALMSADDIQKVVDNIPAPLCVNMGLGFQTRGTTPLITPIQLQAMGVAMVNFPRLLTTAAVKGMQNCMTAFKQMIEGEEPEARDDLQISFSDLGDLMELPFLDELDEKYAVSDTAAVAK